MIAELSPLLEAELLPPGLVLCPEFGWCVAKRFSLRISAFNNCRICPAPDSLSRVGRKPVVIWYPCAFHSTGLGLSWCGDGCTYRKLAQNDLQFRSLMLCGTAILITGASVPCSRLLEWQNPEDGSAP